MKAMTEGEDAQGEAIVKISVDGSELVTGRGVAVDVIKAYINGINKFFME